MSNQNSQNLLAGFQARRSVVGAASWSKRAAQRGVSLVEVMIVVAIMAMIAGGVALSVVPQFSKAQRETALTGGRTMRRAVQSWQMLNGEVTCPTVSMLIEQKMLDRGMKTDDPWGQPYEFNCSDDEVWVLSYGPDKKKGTKDDVSVPENLAGNQG